jgi:RNA 2',3'-cyclic 3'-phosphodiesterase
MTFRGFISFDIEVSTIMKDFCDSLERCEAALKIVNTDILHITLKFLGNVSDSLVPDIKRVMEESVREVPSFEIHALGVGAFPSVSNIRVVWIGISEPGNMKEIAMRLDEGLEPLGFRREERPFTAHLTVARSKGRKGMSCVRELIRVWEGVSFDTQSLDRIRLKKSVLSPKGPAYTTIEEVPLRG